MNRRLSRRVRLALRILMLAGPGLLAGCISSNEPMLSDARPLLGQNPHFQFFTLTDGAATEPSEGDFDWRNGLYVPADGPAGEIGPFTVHTFEGADLLVQSSRPGKPVEYAIARKLADGTYLIFAVDEQNADDATRKKYCGEDRNAACSVTSREAVLVFARAAAAKPHTTGGLAILMKGQ
jgi:hypothetical protein